MKNALKRSLSFLLAITIIFGSAAVGFSEVDFGGLFAVKAEAAYSGTCGENLTWVLDDNGNLTISGVGKMLDFYDMDNPWCEYFDSVKNVEICYGVTSIGNTAFNYCENLKSITIPDSVTSIGNYAFYCCTGLTSIEIPDSVTSIGSYAFNNTGYYNDSNNWENDALYIGNHLVNVKSSVLGSVGIKDGTRTIAGYAFDCCASLTSIEIPDSVKSVGSYAFSYCTSLESIIIPDSVRIIGERAFSYCTSLTRVQIGDSVISIGEDAFYGCSKMMVINVDSGNQSYLSVDGVLFEKNNAMLIHYPSGKSDSEYIIPDSVTSIGSGAFSGCTNLTSVDIPDSVTSIGNYAFYGCTGLTSVIIPRNVTSIGSYVFYNCESLTSITIPDAVTSIGDSAFSSCYNLMSITIPDSVTSIGSYAFSRCKSLTSIEIPGGITSIGIYAFNDTGYYNDVNNWDVDVLYIGNHLIEARTYYSGCVIKDGTKTIASSAFARCEELYSITIPDSVTNIGYSAFSNCYELRGVYIIDVNAWCNINFEDYSSNPLCYSNCLYINGELAEDVIVPDGVTEIPTYAFSCYSLKSLTIPDSVTSIGNYAFYGCSNLTSITIPKSVTSIGSCSFECCFSLGKVNYLGTIAQWKEIDIEDRNECLTEAYYSQFSPPATPKLTSATRVSNGVKVVWGEVEGADSYIVYRKTSKSGWTNLGTTTENTFTDTKAKTGTTYYYTVKAQNEAGYSGYNTKGLGIKYVAAPKLTKIANESSGVRVYWSKVSGADGYYLYRRVAGSKTWTKIATIKKGSTTSYLDKKASAGKTYEYIIKCYDGSTPSASAAKVIKIERLTVPKLVSAKSGKSGITFKWGKVTGAEGYLVYRKTGKASWSQVGKVEGNSTFSYVDTSAKKGKTYAYTVRAYSGSYKSAYNTKGLSVKDKY